MKKETSYLKLCNDSFGPLAERTKKRVAIATGIVTLVALVIVIIILCCFLKG